MNVALYFGSFYPPHKGHAAIADYLHKCGDFDAVRVVLSPCNPFKQNTFLLDDAERVALVRAWTDTCPYLRLSTLEFEMERPSYTYLTLRRIRAEEPDSAFALVLGTDSLMAFPKWRECGEIALHHPLYVYPRPGYAMDEALAFLSEKLPQARVRCMDAPLFPYASSEIRDALQRGEDVSEKLPPAVWEHIRKNHLFR
ncbi:MAG: nicotinate (nicotinamide) nucleotide adenylyltransferase [Bacteroidales bacterium]|nr:nicotinate (nicotinamide) nucleotide adenylyltransferase [Bacteroidales bacterium]